MPIFKDMKFLCAALQTKIDTALVSDVAPAVKDVLHDKIEENVYNRYSPVQYERRGELGSVDNMQEELEAPGVMAVRNTANPSPSVLGYGYLPGDGTNFAGWVNDGNVPNIFNNANYPWEQPAHFIEDAQAEINNGRVVKDALKSGLKKLGVDAV